MIIKYDIEKFFKDKGLKQSHFAKKLGISKQLMNYHIKKGDLNLSQLQTISEELEMSADSLIKTLIKNYIKTKI